MRVVQIAIAALCCSVLVACENPSSLADAGPGDGGFTVIPLRSDLVVSDFSPGGALGGTAQIGGVPTPVVATSYNAALQTLQFPPGEDNALPTGISTAGAIVGTTTLANNGTQGVYWASAKSSAQLIALPQLESAGAPSLMPSFAINANNQLAAVSIESLYGNLTYKVWYYANPAATPIEIAETVAGDTAQIDASGGILLISTALEAQLFLSATAAATPIKNDDGTLPANLVLGGNGTIIANQNLSATGANLGEVWLPSDYASPRLLTVPANIVRSEALSINDSGAIGGDYQDSTGVYHPCYWPTPASAPIEVPAGTQNLAFVSAIFDSGAMIASTRSTQAGGLQYRYVLIPH